MRPRDSLNRQKRIYLTTVALGFSVMVVLAFSDKYLPPSLNKAMTIVAVTVFAVGILLVYWGIRCPRCHATLGLRFVYAEETLRHCPRCGVDFDEDSP